MGKRAAGRVQRLLTARRSHDGTWALDVKPALLPGTYTARARQLDARGNRGVERDADLHGQGEDEARSAAGARHAAAA